MGTITTLTCPSLGREATQLTLAHFILGGEGSDAGLGNAAVIQAIKDTIVSVKVPPVKHKVDLVQELQPIISKNIRKYFSTGAASTKMEVIFDSNRFVLHVEGSSAEQVNLRQTDPGTFVSLSVIPASVRYSILETQNKKLRVLLDLPGCNLEVIKDVIMIEADRPGPKITVYPGTIKRLMDEGDNSLEGSREFDARDAFSFKVPRRVRGQGRNGQEPKQVSYDLGVMVLEWDIEDAVPGRPFSIDDY